MILGISVSKRKGETIFVISFSKTFDENKATLLSQLLEALKSFSETGLGKTIKKISLENVFVYSLESDNYSIAIFSDEEDESLEDILNEILNVVESYNPEKLQFDEKVRNEVLANIRFRIFISYHELKILKRIASSLDTLIKVSDVRKVDIEVQDIKPKKMKIKRKSILFGRSKKYELYDILSLFENGEIEKIVEIPVENIGGENIDLAKALFVRAGLILARRPPKFKAPSIEDLWSIANSIGDSMLRSYLENCVMESLNVNAAIKRRMAYLEIRDRILSKLAGDPSIKKSLLIIFMEEPDMRLITERIREFRGSSLLYSLAKSSYYIIRFLVGPQNRSAWLSNVSMVYNEAIKSSSNPEYAFLLLPLAFTALSIVNIRDFSEEDFEKAEKILSEVIKIYEQIKDSDKNYLSTYHINAMRFFAETYPAFIRTIIYGKENDFRRLKQLAVTGLKEAVASNKHLRRRAQFYCIISALYLGLVAYVYYREKAVVENIADMLESLLDEPLYLLWNVNRFHYLAYILGITYALTFSLLALPKDEARNELLEQMVPIYRQLWFLSRRVPMIAILLYIPVVHLKNSLEKEIPELNSIVSEAKEIVPQIIVERCRV